MSVRHAVSCALAAGVLAWPVCALPVPVETVDGLTLRIEELDPLPPPATPTRTKADLGAPVRDASVPLAFSFSLSNGTARAVTGVFSAWMNDDWTLDGPSQEELTLAPGAVRKLQRTAKAGSRVLPALYPVHAQFRTTTANLHPVAIFRAKTSNRAFGRRRDRLGGDAFMLDETVERSVHVKVGEKNARRLANPNEADGETSGYFRYASSVWCGGTRREGYHGHPPYKTGAGAVWSVWPVEIPASKDGCRLKFAVGVPEARSDGVGVRVFVGEDGPDATAYSVHQTETGRWVEHEADLSRWGGRRTTIGILIDTGPARNTSFDGFCVSKPVVVSGAVCRQPTAAEWNSRIDAASTKARAALANGTDAASGRYRLELDGGIYGAGVVYGDVGIVDGAIAFTDGTNTLAVKGFTCEVDGLPLVWRKSLAKSSVKTRVWAEKGTLKIAWSMSRANKNGAEETPRFTRLAAGACNAALERVYAGMGNVIERPEKFTMPCNGFACSTRHVGADYANGLSLVQASDVFPDEVLCDAAENVFALATHHDATLSFTPSRRGAFDAAVRFAAVSGYRKSPGFDKLASRIVLDDWSGHYAVAAQGLPLSRKYGLDAVYLQHNWQRWGYDVRLPEIWPPKGDRAAFDAMCKAARDSGTILGLHDNYIDLYPDVTDFTYDNVYFTPDGLPHEAWYNPGPRLLSYKWRPDAIWGWHSRNMKAMASEAGTGALFIDVFTASAPHDWYDRSGRFHSKDEQAACWAAAFDRARMEFGISDAVMVSEAGHDALIGHVDAGEADHFTASRILWNARFADAERVPWHDAVSHGKMVLLGGGLGSRYAGTDIKQPGADEALHGYASHDYLCTTVLGGRGAMCGGAFSHKGVMTWWLLGDVLRKLAQGRFRAFAFGRDIHEQHTVFSTGEVWGNRATNRCWTVNGRELPPYGFLVRAGDCEAAVERRGGMTVRVARSPGRIFVDACPPAAHGGKKLAASATDGFVAKGARNGILKLKWTVFDAKAGEYRPFVHAVPHGNDGKIAFQCGMSFADGTDALARPGLHEATIQLTVPASFAPGAYDIRYGLFHKKTGERTALHGWDDGTMRLFGGVVEVGADGALSWQPDAGTARTRELGLNVVREQVDFGGVVTDGAFNLEFRPEEIVLTPLPGSLPFRARIDLGKFGFAGCKVKALEPVDPWIGSNPPRWQQDGDVVTLAADACAFAYRLAFRRALKAADIFADHMVLAADRSVRVFGMGDGKVTVTFRGRSASASSADGRWMVELPAGTAGGPFEMTIDLDGRKHVVRDVMVGEVLLMAGQSNMQFRLAESTTDPAKWVDDPLVRSFSLPRLEKGEPYRPEDGWIPLARANAGRWSAIGYEVAVRRRAKKGVAVGVINCYQGASVIQTWMPEDLAREPRFALPPEGCAHHELRPDMYSLWNGAGTLYRESFSTIVPYGVTHVTWYQGESNTGKMEGGIYDKLLAAMIGRWREDLREPDLPFAVIQLADFTKAGVGWKAVQNAQTRVPGICPHVKCIRCADVCENDSIHPPTKWRLAERIADSF